MTFMHLITFKGEKPLEFTQSNEMLNATLWKSVDGDQFRAYVEGQIPPSSHSVKLEMLTSLQGANFDEVGDYHYIVETDIESKSEEEFNAWYDTEHLPGLASVPGTISAKRYLRLSGSPRYIACYELVSPAVMESKEWLAIRNTPWSSRIRPLFKNTVRELFVRTTK